MTEVGRATVIIDADDSRLQAGLAKAKQDASAGVAGIEQNLRGQLSGGISGALSGKNWKQAGMTIGADLVQGVTAPLGALGNIAGSTALAMGPVGIAAVAGVAAAGALGVASSRAAMEWEAGMAQISKTTGIEKGTEAFNELDASLTNLYSRMPTTVAEIQSVAAAAGSLGIEKASIAGFTEVALQMGSAFDMPAEEAATAIGKIKGQLKSLPEGVQDSSEFARQFGSAVDYVGNNFNATEKDVLDFSTRVAGSMSSLGAGAYEVAGWGGMLSSVFPSAERAAGSFDALLNQLTTNEKSQAEAASLLGVSTEEFMQAMSTDPSDTILRIGSALESLPADKLLSTAKTLGGSYGMDALTKMIGHTDEWRQSIEDTVEAGKKGESIGESFEAGADNMKASLQVLKNSFNAILKDIGGPINAAISPIITSMAGSLNAVRQIGENLWEPMTAGLAPLITGITQVTGMIGTMGGMNLSVLVSSTSALNTAFRTGKAYVEAFKEEIIKTVTSSSQFQALTGALDSIKNKLSEVGAFWGDIFGDIIDGLANAIPTAVSGAVSALGSLASQGLNKIGLGGVAEGASSLLGDLAGFWDRVSTNAKEKLGIATEEGMGEGAANAEDSIAASVERAVSAGASSGFSKQMAEMDTAFKNLTSSGVSKDIAGWRSYGGATSDLAALAAINAQSSNTKGYGGLWGRGSGSLYAVDEGVQVRLDYHTDKNTTQNVLYLNGQKMAEGSWYGSQEEALQDLFRQAGYPLSEATSLTLQGRGGDLAKLQMDQGVEVRGIFTNVAGAIESEIESTGNMINQSIQDNWFDPESLKSAASRLKNLRLFDPTEFAQQGGENALAYVNALNDKLESLEAARIRLEADPDDAQARAEVQSLIGDLQLFAKQNPLIVTIDGDDSLLMSKVINAYVKGEDLSKLGISNVKRFFSASYEEEVSQLQQYLQKGLAPTPGSDLYSYYYDKYKALVDNYDSLSDRDKQYTWDLGTALHEGGAYWEEFGIRAGVTLDGINSKTKGTTVGFDQLKSAMQDCTETMSEFGLWQEQNAETLFQGSYIGAGGEQYLDWKLSQIQSIAATQKAMASVGGAVLGKDYTDFQLSPSLDTSAAESQWSSFQAKLTEEQKIPLSVDDSQAMSAIAAIDAAASAPVTKPVYVQQIGGYGGGGGSTIGPTSGWAGPGKGAISSPSNYQLPPIFQSFANEGYIASPTLAIVGDRPGGEYVVGAARFEAAIERFGGGSGQVVINAPVTIQGNVYGISDLDAYMDERDRQLEAKLSNARKR
jgi:TP901 family phage tail tape measure protein